MVHSEQRLSLETTSLPSKMRELLNAIVSGSLIITIIIFLLAGSCFKKKKKTTPPRRIRFSAVGGGEQTRYLSFTLDGPMDLYRFGPPKDEGVTGKMGLYFTCNIVLTDPANFSNIYTSDEIFPDKIVNFTLIPTKFLHMNLPRCFGISRFVFRFIIYE